MKNILIFITIAAIAGGGLYLYSEYKKKKEDADKYTAFDNPDAVDPAYRVPLDFGRDRQKVPGFAGGWF